MIEITYPRPSFETADVTIPGAYNGGQDSFGDHSLRIELNGGTASPHRLEKTGFYPEVRLRWDEGQFTDAEYPTHLPLGVTTYVPDGQRPQYYGPLPAQWTENITPRIDPYAIDSEYWGPLDAIAGRQSGQR